MASTTEHPGRPQTPQEPAAAARPPTSEQEQEQQLLSKYGGLRPKATAHLLLNKSFQRKHFDSADYELQKQRLPTDSPSSVPMECLPARLAPVTPQAEVRPYRKSNLE